MLSKFRVHSSKQHTAKTEHAHATAGTSAASLTAQFETCLLGRTEAGEAEQEGRVESPQPSMPHVGVSMFGEPHSCCAGPRASAGGFHGLNQELVQVVRRPWIFAWLGRSRTTMIPHATGCWPQAHLHNMHAPFSCSARTESANCECTARLDLSTFPLGLDDLTRWHEESSPIVRKRFYFDMFR